MGISTYSLFSRMIIRVRLVASFCVLALVSVVTAHAQDGMVQVKNAGTSAVNSVYMLSDKNNLIFNANFCAGTGDSTGPQRVFKDGSTWKINDASGTTLYTASYSGSKPPSTGWSVASGTAPAPTLEGDVAILNAAPTVTGVPSDLSFTEDTQGNVDLSGVTVADGDGDALTVTVTASAGVFGAPGIGSGVTAAKVSNTVVTLAGTVAAINAYLGTATNLQYTPASNIAGNDVATIKVKANDGTVDSTEHTANVDVTPVNDPPVLDATQSPALTAIDEDSGDDDGSGADGDDDATANTNNQGTSIGDIVVTGSITDVDLGSATKAIAVTNVDNTNGVWQYTTDDGTNWSAFSATTGSSVDISSSARLLQHTVQASKGGASTTNKIRFVPNANYSGSSTFTFRAWDGSTGSAGGTADASSGGTGTSPFSSNTDTASITVNAVNDPAVIAGTSAGQTVDDTATVDPFTAVTISDQDGDNLTATISLDDNAKGALSGTDLSGTGPYTIASKSAADMQTAIRALTFTPAPNRSATNETTTLTITINDGTADTSDNTTTVVSSAVGPTITGVSIPATAMKVGSSVTATITVASDTDDYTSGSGGISGTIGGFTLGSLSRVSATSYTASFTVTDGGTDVAAGANIPVNVTLSDSGGKASSAFTTTISQAGDPIDANRPTLSSTLPANNATGVAIDSDLVLTFSEDVSFGTAGVISVAKGAETHTTVDVTNPGALASITGAVLTIDPATNLDLTTDYTVAMASSAIKDAAGNTYASSGGLFSFQTASNSAPTITGAPTDLPFTEDTAGSVDLSSVVVADAENDALTVTLTASAGSFASPASGAGVGGGVTATRVSATVITLAGAAVDITSYLDTATNILYKPALNVNGNDVATIKIKANDSVLDSSEPSINVDVTAVNDNPTVVAVPSDVTVIEDVASNVDLSALTLADVDAGANDIELQITVGAGILTASEAGGVEVAGSGSATLTLTGTATEIDTYLNTASAIKYTGAGDVNGNDAATITLTGNDQGHVGAGGGTDVQLATINIDITAVNDAPSFTKGADQTVLEDAGAQTVNTWATNLSKGPADEAGQTLSFNVSNDNNALFSNQPAIAANGTLTFTPADDAVGSATVTVSISDDGGTANGGLDRSADQTFTITVAAVNDVPSFTKGADQTVLEDAGAQTVNTWATNLSKGPADEAGQTLSFNVSNINNALFAVQPAIAANGTLTYTPAANANGSATVTVSISDDGGTANGGVDTSADQTFTITVTAVNDNPTVVSVPSDVTVIEDVASNVDLSALTFGDLDSGANDIALEIKVGGGVLTASDAGGVEVNGSGTATLTLTGTATEIDTYLNTASAIKYTGAGDVNGNDAATITLTGNDQGHVGTGGGTDVQLATINIDITAVNDAPSFTKGADQTVLEDAGAQTVNTWATNLSKGPADEAGQTLSFNVSNDNNALFATQPSIALNGTLTFTPADDAVGSATVTVSISDDGGTANGGLDKSADQTFTITVTAVNDAPSFTKGTDDTVNEDSGARTVNNWATNMSKGPADEAGQTLSFNVSNNNNALFSNQPAIAANGTLTYTPAANANGSATVTVSISDDGGTANGGVDTSADQTFTITVTAVNDNPTVVSVPSDVTVIEDVASNVDLSALTFEDLDSGANDIALEIKVGGGVLTASDAGGVEVNGSGTATLTLTGTATEIDTYLNTASAIKYTGAGDVNGNDAATITLTGNDQGHVGTGGGTDVQLATINIDITAVNDEPTFTMGADVTVDEDSGAYSAAFATNISAGPADESGQALTFHVTNNTNAALFSAAPTVTAGGTLTFTPAPNMNGTADITIELRDDGGTDNNGDDASPSATFTITVNAVNDGPVITLPASPTMLEDGSLTLTSGVTGAITVADSDAAGGDLTMTLTATSTLTLAAGHALDITAGGDGTSTLTADGTVAEINAALDGLVYNPSADQNGNGTIKVDVTDNNHTGSGGAKTDSKTLTIDITPVNDEPSFAAGNNVSVEEDSGDYSAVWATSISTGPTNESDQSASFLVTTTNQALFAEQPAIAPDGTLTFTLAANANGQATVTVVLSDDGGTSDGGDDTADTEAFMIAVNAVNDAPVLTMPATAEVDEDGSVVITGISVEDPDATELSLSITATSTATLGSTTGLTITGGSNGSNSVAFSGTPLDVNAALASITYAPSANQTTGASLTVSVSDGELSDEGTTQISVNSINDLPIAVDDALTLPHGTSLPLDVLANDSDVESAVLTVVSVTQPSMGSVSINTDNTLTVTAGATDEGETSFTYTIEDGDGGQATATVSVTITGPGPDGDGIDEEVEENAPNGGDGNGDGTPDSQQNNVASVPVATGANQGEYMTLVSPENTGLQQVYSTDIPDPSTAPENVEFPVGRVAFKVSDIEPGQKSVVDIIMPRGVEVVSYYKYGPTPDNAEDHWYEFLFDGDTGAIIHPETADDPPRVELHLIDGQRGDADLTANGVIDDPGVPIFKTNKLPVAAADAATLDEDASITIDVLVNDTDADQDVLSIANVIQPANGTVTVVTDGQLTYTPNANYFGTDTFRYLVTDGNGAPVTATVTVAVNPLPDAPVAGDDAATTDEETPVVINIFANDSDADGDAFFLITGATSPNAEIVFDGQGSITYTPNEAFDGLDRFSYTISDPSGLTAMGWVEVTVNGTNDAPVAVTDAVTTEEDTAITIDVLANDTDEENNALSISSFTQPANGSVANVDGALVYTPAEEYSGTDSFTYTITDGDLNVTGNVIITVVAVNDAPSFGAAAIDGPTDVFFLNEAPYEARAAAATDPDDEALTYTYEILRGTNNEEVVFFSSPDENGMISIEAAALIEALEPHGLVPGAQVTFFHRLVATDDQGAEGSSVPQEVTFARALNTSTAEAGFPTEYFLSDNYPNPFNPSTTIEFGLPEAAHVTIMLYDMNGRMVQFITDRRLSPGVHTQRIDMGTLPSGIYLYRMTAGNQAFTKTLHLIK